MTHSIPSESYKKLGQQLIDEMEELAYIKASTVKIAFLVSDQAKTESRRPVYAETELIPEKYKWGLDADFAITVYPVNASVFSEKQRAILIFQQLLKIGINYDDVKDKEKYFLNDYDVNDFDVIINRYGTDWKETQQNLFKD